MNETSTSAHSVVCTDRRAAAIPEKKRLNPLWLATRGPVAVGASFAVWMDIQWIAAFIAHGSPGPSWVDVVLFIGNGAIAVFGLTLFTLWIIDHLDAMTARIGRAIAWISTRWKKIERYR